MITYESLIEDQTIRYLWQMDNSIWYKIVDRSFTFPVPIEDIVGVVQVTDDAAPYSKYIRKEYDRIKSAYEATLE